MQFNFNLSDGLKANEVLAEDATIRAVDAARRLEGKVSIPVTMKGMLVGYATVLKDGTITAELNESPEGRELRDKLLEGSANCISLGPNPKSPNIRPLSIEGLN